MNLDDIRRQMAFVLRDVELPASLGSRHSGKVRESVALADDRRLIIATDRTSVFDFPVGCVPFKGQVLTQISKHWFDATTDIVPNHVLEVIDPNVMLVRNCRPLPMEVVVRGYISGVTTTSMWRQYSEGARTFCGHALPEGLRKNQKLSVPLVTPSTKETRKGVHDKSVGRDELLAETGIEPRIYDQVVAAATMLFDRGTKLAAEAGFILVDTKYEFGLDPAGGVMLIDEVHTPDSSRYWPAAIYAERFERGQEMDNYDKEYIRLYLSERGLTEFGQDKERGKLPDELFIETSARFIQVCEAICGAPFSGSVGDAGGRIRQAIADRSHDLTLRMT